MDTTITAVLLIEMTRKWIKRVINIILQLIMLSFYHICVYTTTDSVIILPYLCL